MKLASLKQHSLLYPLAPILLRRFAKGFNVNSKHDFAVLVVLA
jgi:hypothetical protein